VFLGWIVLSEHIGPITLLGAAVIVASVAFIVRREDAGAPDEADDAADDRRTVSRAAA